MISETTEVETTETVITHACDERLGAVLTESLQEWAQTQPERCHQVQYKNLSGMRSFRVLIGEDWFDVALSLPWTPTESELAIVDRAVFKAATERGWKSSVMPEFDGFGGGRVYVGRTLLGNYVAKSECCESTIARIQSYLAASRGEF